MKSKTLKTVSVLLIISFIICFCACNGKTEAPETIKAEKTQDSNLTSTPVETESEWDRSTIVFEVDTTVKFELHVKEGFSYSLENFDEGTGCIFSTSDGKPVSVHVQGFEYGKDYDNLVNFMKSLNPEKLKTGKTSKAIFAVYNSEKTEICTKITDSLCLTLIGENVDAIGSFLKTVMLRVDGNEYIPYDLSEEFDIIVSR